MLKSAIAPSGQHIQPIIEDFVCELYKARMTEDN